MGKGEIARYEQFLLFPQCFQKACLEGASKGVLVWEWVNSTKHQNFEMVKLKAFADNKINATEKFYVSIWEDRKPGKNPHLTFSQRIDLRLFRTERVCRRQLQI